MKQAIILLFAFALATLMAAQTKKMPWKEMVYASDGFAITVPYPPLPHADASIPDTNAYTIFLPGETHAGLTLRVMHQARDCKETLGRLKAAANVDASSIRELSIDGHPGLSYRWQTDQATMRLDHYYCVKDRWYVFSASWPSADQYPPSIGRVIHSFRLIKHD